MREDLYRRESMKVDVEAISYINTIFFRKILSIINELHEQLSRKKERKKSE
jgi:hypothetical protein